MCIAARAPTSKLPKKRKSRGISITKRNNITIAVMLGACQGEREAGNGVKDLQNSNAHSSTLMSPGKPEVFFGNLASFLPLSCCRLPGNAHGQGFR